MDGLSLSQNLSRVHPLLFYVVQKGVLAALLGFTSATSPLRYGVMPILLLANYAILPAFPLHVARGAWRGLLAAETLNGPLDYIEKLLLSQWTFEDYGPSAEIRKRRAITSTQATATKSNAQEKSLARVNGNNAWIEVKDTAWNRIKFGLWAATSTRYINTPFQAKNAAPYSTSDPAYIPTRTKFLLRHAGICAVCFLVTDFLGYNSSTDQNHVTFAADQVPFFSRLNEVTAKQVIARVSTSIGFWFGTSVTLQFYYASFAFIIVALGVASPADWRPAYGSFSSVNSLRTFWGIWWHQTLRKRLTKPSRYLVFNILGLPRPSAPQSTACRLFTRYLQLFGVFAISGLFHQIYEVGRGQRLTEAGALSFWVLMACGIVVEDLFQWIVRPWRGGASAATSTAAASGAGQKKTQMKWINRLVGYVWLILFYSWATPTWAYPMLRGNNSREQTDLLPFNLLRWITGKA